MEPIPFEFIDSLKQCFGRCFYYKDTLVSFLVTCGLEHKLASKYKGEYKFVWAEKLLGELNETEEGRLRIKRIITGFNQLRKLPDAQVADKDAGLSALRHLKELITKNESVVANQKRETISRYKISQEKEKLIQQRASKLESVRNAFYAGFSCPNRQEAGFSLEDIIKDLFALSNIEYKKSYKTETQQIDGHFRFEGFDYLVEAKWRKDLPNESEIGSFQRKVNTKLESTRGLFLSVNDFRDEVVKQFNGKSNIIFFTGEDLTLILEGRIELTEVLVKKIERAAQYGDSLVKVKDLLKTEGAK